jgi:hypothetical protein
MQTNSSKAQAYMTLVIIMLMTRAPAQLFYAGGVPFKGRRIVRCKNLVRRPMLKSSCEHPM